MGKVADLFSPCPGIYIPPAWTNVWVNPDESSPLRATGTDAAGRKQYVYSKEHHAAAKAGKFERVRSLLEEWDAIESQIVDDLNNPALEGKDREAALVALLIYRTGMRPGSNSDTLAAVDAYGATTIQLRHVKPCARGVRLQFIGKKGVPQNVLVTDPFLVYVLTERKRATPKFKTPVFRVSSTKLNQYISGLGSGDYTAKDFRTACGTGLAIQLLGSRKRLPKTVSKRKKIVNDALDKVARLLGNTRSVSRNSYVDPGILERFFPVSK